jgi:hypothetical protein
MLAVAAAIGADRGSAVHAQDRLWETIKAVRQNEALYANLDVLLRCEYETGDGRRLGDGFFNVEDSTPDQSAASRARSKRDGAVRLVSQFGTRFVGQRSETFHFVSQDGMIRRDWKGTSTFDDGKQRSWHRMLLFDGTTTRLSDESPPHDCYPASAIVKDTTIRPHMLVFRSWDLDASLSEFLEGEREWEASYQGKEEIDGLKCRRVRITKSARRQRRPSFRVELWLAEEKNYIPVHMLEYKPFRSDELPHAEAAVDQWREIGPGVWFPTSTSIAVYSGPAPKRENTQKLSWREQCTVEQVSLEPTHAVTFFRQFDSAARAAGESP